MRSSTLRRAVVGSMWTNHPIPAHFIIINPSYLPQLHPIVSPTRNALNRGLKKHGYEQILLLQGNEKFWNYLTSSPTKWAPQQIWFSAFTLSVFTLLIWSEKKKVQRSEAKIKFYFFTSSVRTYPNTHREVEILTVGALPTSTALHFRANKQGLKGHSGLIARLFVARKGQTCGAHLGSAGPSWCRSLTIVTTWDNLV